METLFIVDVQQKFRKSFDEEYVDNLIEYIIKNHKKYDKIVSIMEINIKNEDRIPESIKNKLTYYPIFKCYDEDYSMEKLKKSKYFKIKKSGIEFKVDIPEGSFIFKENQGYLFGKKNENEIEMDFINDDLYNLFNSLRLDNITLVGGGRFNCLKKTKSFLEFMDIESTVLEEQTYEIEDIENPCPKRKFDVIIENKNKTL